MNRCAFPRCDELGTCHVGFLDYCDEHQSHVESNRRRLIQMLQATRARHARFEALRRRTA